MNKWILFKDVPKTSYSIFLSLSLCFSSQLHLEGIEKKQKTQKGNP